MGAGERTILTAAEGKAPHIQTATKTTLLHVDRLFASVLESSLVRK